MSTYIEVLAAHDRLEAELAKARAQIAQWEHDIKFWGIIEIAVRNISVSDYMDQWEGRTEKAETELAEARAQIAAKDAALREIATECSTFPIKEGLAFRCESIALNGLATPAQETE